MIRAYYMQGESTTIMLQSLADDIWLEKGLYKN